jgi:hypothetical protein
MSALSKAFPQDPSTEIISRWMVGLGAGAIAWMGGTAVRDTKSASPTQGYFIPANANTGQQTYGRFIGSVSNSAGANGAQNVEVELVKPIYVLHRNNSTVNPCGLSSRGALCYNEDDNTVGTNSSGFSQAGRIWDIIGSDVLVEMI